MKDYGAAGMMCIARYVSVLICALSALFSFFSCGASVGDQLGIADAPTVYEDTEIGKEWMETTLLLGSDRWFYFDAQPGYTYYTQVYSISSNISPQLYKSDKKTAFPVRTAETDYCATSYVCTPASAERVFLKVPLVKESAMKISLRIISYQLNGDAVVIRDGRTYFGGFTSGTGWTCINATAGKRYVVIQDSYSNTKVSVVPYHADKVTPYSALSGSLYFGAVFIPSETGFLYFKISSSAVLYGENTKSYNLIVKEETLGDYTSPIPLTVGVETEGSFSETDTRWYSFPGLQKSSYSITRYDDDMREGYSSMSFSVSTSLNVTTSYTTSNPQTVYIGSSDDTVRFSIKKISVSPDTLSRQKFALIVKKL